LQFTLLVDSAMRDLTVRRFGVKTSFFYPNLWESV